MKIGLFFGSFNPIHVGHLIIGNTMAQHPDLEEVWFVVSPQNPFKSQKNLLHEFDRLDLVELAIGDNYKLRASDVEFHMPKPSYTIDTLTVLQEKHPQKEFALIMGSDNLVHFHKWKNHDKILEYYSIYAFPRPESQEHPLLNHPKVIKVESPLMDISATYIRKSIQAQRSIRYLVPDIVADRIRAQKFFL